MILRFAEFELDVNARALRRGAEMLSLEPRAFDLLAHLARNAERVVSRDELLRVVWPGVRVTRSSVDQAIRSIRRTLGDDARAPRFVRTVARRGVQFAGELADAPARARSGAYVGRAPLLARLREQLDAAANGAGGVALITGPAGIGKTRTASEVLGWASARGLATAQTACSATSGTGCAPWLELAQQLAPGEVVPAAERSSLFSALRAALTRSALPSAVLVDDLHDADESSIAFLDSLASFAPRHPLLVLVTARDVEHWSNAAAAEAFLRTAARARVVHLSLGPLEAPAVGELIEAQIGVRPSSARCEALAERTEGNPLWIHQLLHAGLGSELAREAKRPGESGSFRRAIAQSLKQAIAQRLAVIDATITRTLHAAAVLGDEIDPALVAEISGIDVQHVRAALTRARATGFVSGGDTRPWRFGHRAFHDALLEGIESDRLSALHLAAARALERRGEWTSVRRRAEVAQHVLAAGASGEPARAVALGLAAGVEAAAHHALDRAEALLAAASGLLDAADAPGALRCAVWTELAVIRERRNSFDRSGAADRAIALARELALPESFARAVLARVGGMDRIRLPEPATVRLLEEALERLAPQAHVLRARLLGRLQAETRYALDFSRTRKLHDAALTEARASGDIETELWLLDLPYGGFWAQTTGDERLATLERAVAYGERSGRREIALSARFLRAQELACRGELQQVARELDWADAEADDLDAGPLRYRVRVVRALLATAVGDFDASDRLATEAQAMADSVGAPGIELARVHRLMNALGRGRAAEVLPLVRLARARDVGPGVWALLIHVFSAAGARAECVQEIRAFSRDALPSLVDAPNPVANALLIACAAAFAGVPEIAPALEAVLEPERGRIAARGLMAHHGPVALGLASCAALRGAKDEAAERLAEAAVLARRAGAVTWLREIDRLRPVLHELLAARH